MTMMTHLSVTQEPLGWLAVGGAVLLLIAVFAIGRLRQKKIPMDEGELDLSVSDIPAPVAEKADEIPVATSGEDDAMMAAMIGAVAAYEEQGAILAAITAAISVVWESEHPGTGFRVVSYRHVGKRSPWNAR